MPPKIKLQVSHGKHKKKQKQSGAKLTLEQPQQPKQKQTAPIKQQKPQNKQKSPNNKQSSKKNKQNIKKSNKVEQISPKKTKQQAQQKQKQADKQLATIQRIKKQEDQTKKTIEELISQYKNAADDIFINHGHNPQKQKTIQMKLEKLQKQHMDRLNKLKNLDQKTLQIRQKKQQNRAQKIKARQQRIKQKKKKKAEEKIQLLKSLSAERLQKQAKYQQYYQNQYRAKIPRYQKYEADFKNRQKIEQQQRQLKIQQIKKKYAPINIDDINQFDDKYQQSKWNLIQQNQKRRQQENQTIQRQNMELKAKLWKGDCHKRVQQQAKQRQRIKNSGKTKLQKTKNYGTIIKQSFKPKINEQKRNLSLSIAQATRIHEYFDEQEVEYKSVARQKYFQGKNKGLVIEKLKKSLQNAEKVKKGNAYLQYVVNLPKNRAQGSQSAALQEKLPQSSPPKKVPSTTFKPKRLKNPYYQNRSFSQRLPSKGQYRQRIKNPQTLQYLVAQMKGKQQQMHLQQKAIKYGRYDGILQLQNRHNKLNKKIVQSINEKLDILNKI